ncbi:hypothetical protein E2320_020653 [Naja naja]|nr:hypothetical protein E2320_020653 [Naja naja]
MRNDIAWHGTKIYIPKVLRSMVLKRCHDGYPLSEVCWVLCTDVSSSIVLTIPQKLPHESRWGGDSTYMRITVCFLFQKHTW